MRDFDGQACFEICKLLVAIAFVFCAFFLGKYCGGIGKVEAWQKCKHYKVDINKKPFPCVTFVAGGKPFEVCAYTGGKQ